MESFTTGLKRIQDACDEVGCKVEYYGDDYGFTVRFYRHCGEGWGEVVHPGKENAQADAQAHEQPQSMEDRIIAFCSVPRTMKEIQTMLEVKDRRTASKYVKQLIEKQRLVMTIPETPNHPNQTYITMPSED